MKKIIDLEHDAFLARCQLDYLIGHIEDGATIRHVRDDVVTIDLRDGSYTKINLAPVQSLLDGFRRETMSNTAKTPYPRLGFFVAHHRFTGSVFKPGGEWGDILDGPCDHESDLFDAILRHCDTGAAFPTRDDFRIWQISHNGTACADVTDWALAECIDRINYEGGAA